MIKDVYRDYFQKSFTFLYPLLEFKRKNDPRPEQTFMFWPGEPVNEKRLYCVYKKDDSEKWENFEKYKLITHKMFLECIPIDDDTIMYVFDMNCYAHEYECVMNGEYSKFSREAKKHISNYYGVHTPEWVYIESFLFPNKYFKIYAEVLECTEESLREVGELCQKYDVEKETFDKSIFINAAQVAEN